MAASIKSSSRKAVVSAQFTTTHIKSLSIAKFGNSYFKPLVGKVELKEFNTFELQDSFDVYGVYCIPGVQVLKSKQELRIDR